mgnify:CR=1 FL=1
MTKAEILRELANHTGTILSFPERGPWGSNHYRGSCSGWIPAFFINKFHVSHMAEVFAGSGTTYDVCKDMNVAYRHRSESQPTQEWDSDDGYPG